LTLSVGYRTFRFSGRILWKGGFTVEEMLAPIANLGFPIVVSIYLLVRVENKLDKLSDSINELARVLSKSPG
jgi:hypothetical protein